MSCEFTARAQSSNSSRFNDLIPTLDGSSWRQMLSVAALNMEISPTNLSSTHHRVDFSSTVEEVCASYASLNENWPALVTGIIFTVSFSSLYFYESNVKGAVFSLQRLTSILTGWNCSEH